MSATKGRRKQNSADGELLDRKASSASQFGHLFLLIFKMKAWRAILLVIPIALILSNVYVPVLFELIGPKQDELNVGEISMNEFYGATDFISSGHKVYMDRATFAREAEAVASIMADRGGGGDADWLVDCVPDHKCRAKFVTEYEPSVVSYIRYSKSSSKPAVLECLWTDSSIHSCAFLYQLMAQSMQKGSLPDGVFRDVQFFTVLVQSESKSRAAQRVKSLTNMSKLLLPKSVCARLVDKGPELFKGILGLTNSFSLGLATLGVAFYLLISTLPCIRSLKTAGFLQHLVRSGLSPCFYWIAIWLITLAECALFSGLFALPPMLHCPGVFAARDLANTFAFMLFYCLALAAMAFILELLLPDMVAISSVLTMFSSGLLLAFLLESYIQTYASFLFYVIPLINARNYTTAYMVSNVMLKMTGSAPTTDRYSSLYQTKVCSMILFALALILLAVYLDSLLKSGNGLCLPLNYPISSRFWCPRAEKRKTDRAVDDSDVTEPHIEPVSGLSSSIVVNKISKAYSSCFAEPGPKVLNGLSCTIYKNQITALIGHNGAGKSTLIKILTGEENPDGGEAHIDGVKVTDPIERLALRGSLSICPQFDALSGSLTVLESIRVTLNCKGVCNDSQVARARAMLSRLGLHDKENAIPANLSGGQKRKVNTILALLGDPKVVFLDEPTSGLDPVSRRQVWQLLQEAKVGRSMVLCTQFMDEADVLADRKIFLSGGQIVCAGSSMFLKRAFGCSLALNVSLKSKSGAQKVIASLKQAELKSEFETELQFEVPASKPDALVQSVQALESSKEIEAFGVSQATLDEIFMKMSGVSSAEIINAFRSGEVSKMFKHTESASQINKSIQLAQSLDSSTRIRASMSQQFRALLCMNLKRQRRDSDSYCARFIMPGILLAVLGIATALLMKSFNEKKITVASKNNQLSAGVTRQDSKVWSVDTSGAFSSPNIVCVFDGPERSGYNETCSRLMFSNGDAAPLLLNKSESESLKSFLSQSNADQVLRRQCNNTVCIVYYATSWNTTVPNKLRNVSIGVFSDSLDKKADRLHAFRPAFGLLSLLFGAGELNSSTLVAHIRPLSKFDAMVNLELTLFLLLFCLCPVSYLADPIEDISSRVRNQLMSMGMTKLAYWANTFLTHWVQYSACFVISIVMLCIWDRYRNAYFLLVCLPVLVLGTASNQLTMYSIAAITREKSVIVLMICEFAAVLLPQIFMLSKSNSSRFVLVPLICLLPPLAPMALIYFSVLFSLYYLDYLNVDHISSIPDLYQGCWNNKYILISMVAMPIHIGIMCGIIALADSAAGICASCCSRKAAGDVVGSMDLGAQKEVNRVLQSVRNAQNVLEVRQLYRTYPNGVRAVRGVTFGSMAGEIFGLLGSNGAGKSTAMSVIVGEEAATSGECEVRMKDGAWVSGRSSASVGAIGYCPQRNPLFDSITVVEHLTMYAGIRGVPPAAAERQVAALVQGLGLQPHRDKQAGQLSGGNKRRLCLAIALLGDPALIVIDEASTGVDPENKRFIWSAIRAMLHQQRSVTVTTHSMEEVEALCSRVGIMNKGRMIAFGTVQQLRSLYGDAYTLEILMRKATEANKMQQKNAIKTAVSSQFKGAVALEDMSLCMQFDIPKASVDRLSSALQWLASNKDQLGMEYFSFYQMSLDQVFVKLVKQYDDASKPSDSAV